jgi:hypothetical protein
VKYLDLSVRSACCEMASVSAVFLEKPQTKADGFVGRNVLSSDLVPGDVYEISDPNLTQFPSDSVLLTGDCIVNESMLTGTLASKATIILRLTKAE